MIDLDDAANRVGAENRALRSAHDLDPLDVAQRHLRQIEAAAERIGADAVDQHEREVRFASARKERGERARPAASRDGEAGHRAQRGAERGDLPRLEVASGENRDAVGRARQRLIDLRGRHDERFGNRADAQRNLDLVVGAASAIVTPRASPASPGPEAVEVVAPRRPARRTRSDRYHLSSWLVGSGR